MSQTTIHQVIGIEGRTLIVFHTEADCWQFRLISNGGAVFGEQKLYYSERSRSEGRVRVDARGELDITSTKTLIFNSTAFLAPKSGLPRQV